MLVGRMGGCQTVLLCSSLERAQVDNMCERFGDVKKQVIQLTSVLLDGGMADTQRHYA